MRVPIPFVILLCFAVIGGMWWYGSRDRDFLTPPSAVTLAGIREKVASSLPPADHSNGAFSAPPEETKEVRPVVVPIVEEPKPVIDPGDLERPPGLREYGESAAKGAAHLIDLAVLLETEGEIQRASLAWERVLDMTKPTETETSSAIAAIKRLRSTVPPWNRDPSKAIAIQLHAGTGKRTAKLLAPALEQAARELEQASAGILAVRIRVAAGRETRSSAGPAPVALWLAGEAADSRSTEVFSFTIGSPESLIEDVRKTLFEIARGYLSRKVNLSPPPAPAAGAPPLDVLGTHITRLHWHELGTSLNQAAEKNE